jgi:hypothetical protein
MDQLPDNSCSSRKQSQTNSSQKKNNRSGNLPGSIVSIQKNKPAEKKTNKCHHNGNYPKQNTDTVIHNSIFEN